MDHGPEDHLRVLAIAIQGLQSILHQGVIHLPKELPHERLVHHPTGLLHGLLVPRQRDWHLHVNVAPEQV
jgi:hypothetical protein